MTNWDLFTNPEAEEFHKSTPSNDKQRLAEEWKEYMKKNHCWISFYEWKKSKQQLAVLMTGEGSSAPGHKWKSLDGQTVESKTTFPPFQSILLESDSQTAKAAPLLIDTGNQLSSIEKQVQNVSEQFNWTNTALRGMATKVFDPNPSVHPDEIVSLQVTTNTAVHAVNQIHEKIVNVDSKLDHVLQEVSEKQT
jgi:hypothetical protein